MVMQSMFPPAIGPEAFSSLNSSDIEQCKILFFFPTLRPLTMIGYPRQTMLCNLLMCFIHGARSVLGSLQDGGVYDPVPSSKTAAHPTPILSEQQDSSLAPTPCPPFLEMPRPPPARFWGGVRS